MMKARGIEKRTRAKLVAREQAVQEYILGRGPLFLGGRHFQDLGAVLGSWLLV
jgi:hypothetical protein